MNEEVLRAWLEARERGTPCALVTLAAISGSVPRAAGAKMLVMEAGKIVGTIGGGKFEALVVEDAVAAIGTGSPALKTYPLHEGSCGSFGAICGGEATVLIEPQGRGIGLVLVGAGHCAVAIGRLARECGFHVTAIDDREELLEDFPAHRRIGGDAAGFIAEHGMGTDALVLVSRNYELDERALEAALRAGGIRYIGMIGSERKVRRVFDELRSRGVSDADLARVYAPVGLDIGADSPAEIAISVVAEILKVLRGASGAHLKMG
jgi:xanthine dehydrogenase accessory factor